MKLFIIVGCILFSFTTFAQITINTDKDTIYSIQDLTELREYSYSKIYPKEFIGNFEKESEYTRYGYSWNTKVKISLLEDGTCNTLWYNSGFAGRKAKTKEVTGFWGIAVDKDTSLPITKMVNGNMYYRIILSSGSEETLAYYDRTTYDDWIIVNPNKEVFLKLIFSSDEPIKKT
jgi:hypothetical protein